MGLLESFAEIIRRNEPMAPYLSLGVGGAAEAFAEPRTFAELQSLISQARRDNVTMRLLGGGSNVVVRDEGVKGLVIRLAAPPFVETRAQGARIRVGAGATLAQLIALAAQSSLRGLEAFVGIPGTVGGALLTNAGTQSETLIQLVREVEVLDLHKGLQTRKRNEITVTADGCDFDDGVVLTVELELEADDGDAILKRMKRNWINRKAKQPFSFQPTLRMFKDVRGTPAEEFIAAAGLAGLSVGQAEVSDRHPNYAIAQEGATARDVLRLVDLVRSRVNEHAGLLLPLGFEVW